MYTYIYPLLPDWVCALACLGVPLLHDRGGQACLFGVAALAHELVSGRVALVRSASGVAEQARACLLAGEWAFHSCTSGRVTRRRVGEWGGREGRGVLLGASRTARVDFMFSDDVVSQRHSPCMTYLLHQKQNKKLVVA